MLPETTYDNATPGNLARLRDALTFDAPCVRVGVDGYARHDAPDNVHAPDAWHDDADDVTGYDADVWELVTGYTGQHGYSGGVMHASEYVGGRLATDVLNNPGIYACVVVDVLPDADTCRVCWEPVTGHDNATHRATPDDDPDPAGWAIFRWVGELPPVTWADGWGTWHAATATGGTDDDADDARDAARAAIVGELRARSGPGGVDTARMRIERAGTGRPQDGRIVWREVWDDASTCELDDDGNCNGACVIYRHTWSPSGARCTVCPIVGTGDTCNDGNCTGHPSHPDTTHGS